MCRPLPSGASGSLRPLPTFVISSSLPPLSRFSLPLPLPLPFLLPIPSPPFPPPPPHPSISPPPTPPPRLSLPSSFSHSTHLSYHPSHFYFLCRWIFLTPPLLSISLTYSGVGPLPPVVGVAGARGAGAAPVPDAHGRPYVTCWCARRASTRRASPGTHS